jgi:hypothetical protein
MLGGNGYLLVVMATICQPCRFFKFQQWGTFTEKINFEICVELIWLVILAPRRYINRDHHRTALVKKHMRNQQPAGKKTHDWTHSFGWLVHQITANILANSWWLSHHELWFKSS